MFKAFRYDELQALSISDFVALHDSRTLLAIFFEPADADFIKHVGSMAAVWLGEEKIKALDVQRLLENQKWLVPVLTTDFLPKTMLLDTGRFTSAELNEVLSKISLNDFYVSPAVHLDYQETFELVFRYSLYYHHLQVSNTDYCNLKCRGCAYHGEGKRYGFYDLRAQRNKQEMDDKIFYSFIDQLPPGKDVLFCPSGEVFVSKNAMNYIRYACNKGMYVRILTNGMLLTPDIARHLVDLNIGAVVFSIDGHRADLVEGIRIGADFSLIMKNLANLQQARDKAGSSMSIGVLTGWFEELRGLRGEIVDFWKEQGVDTLSFFEEKIDHFTDDRIFDINTFGNGLSFDLPCFKHLVTAPLLTNGMIAPCSHHMPIEWSTYDTSWMFSIENHSYVEILKYYREMRLDPNSSYRKNCARCQSKLYCYMTSDQFNVSVDAYNFTGRRIKGEAAFVKDFSQNEEQGHRRTFVNRIFGKLSGMLKF